MQHKERSHRSAVGKHKVVDLTSRFLFRWICARSCRNWQAVNFTRDAIISFDFLPDDSNKKQRSINSHNELTLAIAASREAWYVLPALSRSFPQLIES